MSIDLLTEKQVANKTCLSLSKIQKDRLRKRGLPYVKLGRNVRYIKQEVEQYILDNRVVPDSTGGAYA